MVVLKKLPYNTVFITRRQTMKKIFAAVVILFVAAVAAFAIGPDTVFVDIVSDGVTRSDFDNAFADAEAVSEEFGGLVSELGASIVALEPLDEDDYDSDFDSVYGALMSSIGGNAKSKSVYAAVALDDSDDGEAFYGYIIFAHFNSKSDVKIAAYCFEAEAE